MQEEVQAPIDVGCEQDFYFDEQRQACVQVRLREPKIVCEEGERQGEFCVKEVKLYTYRYIYIYL